ncbi:DUF1499 domain-containing protein [Pelobacter seleniigenes]|uniref:DUF1499 domain-containing protein n=1 Tax=Pelobacter seleniigenes TaxID=407188 RepID=UPI0004A6F27B|nr:DUF1499 domain-containing protein [Pelobacter seleniigenes]
MGKVLARLAGLLIVGIFFGCSGKLPTDLGVENGRLAQCPDSPNCVSSQADPADQQHFIAPFSYSGTKESAVARLLAVLATEKRVTISKQTANYVRAEFRSAWFGFVDDVEFYFPDRPLVEVRSASRLGYSDFGVNRKRIEHLRRLFEQAGS